MREGKTATRLGVVEGINYSSGDFLDLALYDISRPQGGMKNRQAMMNGGRHGGGGR